MAIKSGFTVFNLFFLFLAFLIPLFFYNDIGPSSFTLNMGFCWFIIIFVSFRLASPAIRNKERLLEMSFWLFGYVFMGVVPFIQIMANEFPWPDIYNSDTIMTSLLIILIGMISYQLGISVTMSKKNKRAASERRVLFSSPKFVLVTAICVIACLLLMLKMNEFHSLFLPRNDITGGNIKIVKSQSLSLIIKQLSRVPIFVCLVFGIVMWKNKKFSDQFYPRLIVIALLIINLVLNNPISNARYWFGSVLLTICSLLIPWRRGSFFAWCVGYLLIFLLIFPYSDLFRNQLNPTIQVTKISDIMLHKGDYDAFQMLANTTKVVDLQGDTHGRQLLGALLFWVPRNLWTDKPLSSGQMVGETLRYKFTNLSCPLWGESYLNFGYAGVIVIFALYGFLTRILQNMYMLSKISNSVTMTKLIVPFLAAYQIFFLRGDLMNGIAYLSSFLLFCYIFSIRKENISKVGYKQQYQAINPSIN